MPPNRRHAEKLVGIRPRERRDFFSGCNEPGRAWFIPDAYEFMKIWCARCKQSGCIRAKGVAQVWEHRMETQVGYLLNDPVFSDLSDPHHQELTKIMFASLKEKAERLEISAARQDWEIPEGPTDGIARVAASTVTSDLDTAVRELARAKGTKEPALSPETTQEAGPAFFQETPEETASGGDSEIEYETSFPSSKEKGKTYRVVLTKEGKWSCECDGFRYLAKCRHLNTVKEWYDDPINHSEQPVLQAPSAPPVPRPPELRDPRLPPEQRPLNTPVPQTGVMLRPSPGIPDSLSSDPWAPRKEVGQVVETGATVTVRPKRRT